MGAPTVSLKLLVEKVRQNIDRSALTHSLAFYVPTLSTSLASFGLFGLLAKLGSHDLNASVAPLMLAVIVGLVTSAWLQFVVYKLVDSDSFHVSPSNVDVAGKALTISTFCAIVFSGMVAVGTAMLLRKSMQVFDSAFFSFAILAILYSVIWVELAAIWATGHHSRPAIIFVLSYGTVFLLTFSLASTDSEYIVWGYVAGIAVLAISLSLVSYRIFHRAKNPSSWRDGFSAIWRIVSTNSWGMIFQTLFALSLFLDKIVVWAVQGGRTGAGLQIVGPYTTGSFLGFVPTLSLVASVYYAERLKGVSKGMYRGTLADIRRKTREYRSLYRSGISSMMAIGVVALFCVVAWAAFSLKDPQVATIAATVGAGVLTLQAIIANSAVLSVFNKNYVSALAMLAVCSGELLAAFLVPYDVWYAAVGFFVGSLLGLLISHVSTLRLISNFEYNAFRTFQTVT
jgi:hypothetical protein